MSERDRPDLFPSLTRLARTKDGLAFWIHSGYPRCNLDKADFALFRTNDGKWSTLAQVPVVYSMWECATVQRVAPNSLHPDLPVLIEFIMKAISESKFTVGWVLLTVSPDLAKPEIRLVFDDVPVKKMERLEKHYAETMAAVFRDSRFPNRQLLTTRTMLEGMPPRYREAVRKALQEHARRHGYKEPSELLNLVMSSLVFITSASAQLTVVDDIGEIRKKLERIKSPGKKAKLERKLVTAIRYTKVEAERALPQLDTGKDSHDTGRRIAKLVSVRGHFNRQAYGKERSKRKIIWVEPYFWGFKHIEGQSAESGGETR